MFCVNYWGSKPGTNDDCWQGFDYVDGDEAQAFYNGPHPTWVAWVELDGPDIHAEKANPVYKDTREADDAEWRREMQREDAMLHGVEGWNAWEGM